MRRSGADDLRRTLLKLRRSRSNVQRLKLVGTLPASLGVEIPANSEPRTGLSMGEHAAVTAKQMGIGMGYAIAARVARRRDRPRSTPEEPR
ncbi:acetyl-CoA acetyltransferase [Mycobacterium tuberculosis]|nr:acetyl-CoA acetyltransferase [Mycobacterium tuberculosis]